MTQEQFTLIEKSRDTYCEGCGGDKRSGRAFCYVCTSTLPRQIQADLIVGWDYLGCGYEEAFQAALGELGSRQLMAS